MYNISKEIKWEENVKYIPNEYDCLNETIKDNNWKNIILHIAGDDIKKSIETIKNLKIL